MTPQRILIVEDDDALGRELQETLVGAGFSVPHVSATGVVGTGGGPGPRGGFAGSMGNATIPASAFFGLSAGSFAFFGVPVASFFGAGRASVPFATALG